MNPDNDQTCKSASTVQFIFGVNDVKLYEECREQENERNKKKRERKKERQRTKFLSNAS